MERVRRAEAVAALSLAIDIGMGQPLEQGLRTCSVAVTLAREAGLDERQARHAYYLALLRHVGCTAESDLAAHYLGDEIAFRVGAPLLDWARPSSVMPYAVRHLGVGQPLRSRAQLVGRMMAGGAKKFMQSADAVCETGQLLAARMGMDGEIQRGLWHVFERWDGKGIPGQVSGHEITMPARIVPVAELFEAACRAEGPEQAVEMVRERRGTAFDPAVVDCFVRVSGALVERLASDTVWDDVLDAEPQPEGVLPPEQLDEVLAAVADFTDLKSTFTLGHSRGVAELAEAAATVAGHPPDDAVLLWRAGLVHDVGRVGVSAGVWGKEGKLTRDEWEKVRLHPYYTERVLTRPPALARLGQVASLHHERLDGAGYHRSATAAVLDRPARILAAADGYRGRVEARPHRPAMAPEAAAASLRDEVRTGCLDGDAVEAVLQAAGQGDGRRRRRANPGGLTDREVEVLACLALGSSTKEVAATLTIAPKTADAHIQHIYTKLGVTTRAGATLFAVEHGLVDRARDRVFPR